MTRINIAAFRHALNSRVSPKEVYVRMQMTEYEPPEFMLTFPNAAPYTDEDVKWIFLVMRANAVNVMSTKNVISAAELICYVLPLHQVHLNHVEDLLLLWMSLNRESPGELFMLFMCERKALEKVQTQLSGVAPEVVSENSLWYYHGYFISSKLPQ